MHEFNQNRFSPTKFDAARSEYVGDGKQFTAKYFCKGRTWCATLVWKEGYSGVASLTTLDESAMKSALLRLDSTIRFIGQVNPNCAPVETAAQRSEEMLEALRVDPQTSDKAYISACQLYKQKPKSRTAPAEVRTQNGGRELSFADAKALEALRVDTARTSDAVYRSACAKFGVPPRPRPTQAATPTSQALVPFHVQGEAYGAFMQAHGELFTGIFAEQNATVIANWMHDEGRQCDAASLDQCYRECLAAGYFRDARTLSRDLNGSLRIVRPYNHAELVAMRRQQVADVANQPPAGLSDVDREAWNAVRAKYPQLSVNSAGFKQCMRDTVSLWARQHVSEEHPEWFSQNPVNGKLEPIASKRADVQAAADRVLVQWVRAGNPNLGRGNKTIKDTRIWLG